MALASYDIRTLVRTTTGLLTVTLHHRKSECRQELLLVLNVAIHLDPEMREYLCSVLFEVTTHDTVQKRRAK